MSTPAGELDTTTPPPVALDALAGLFDRLNWLQETTTALLAEQEEIKAAIQGLMGEAEQATVHGRPAVRWARHVRHALDTKALKRDHPELWERYAITSVVRRFTLLTGQDEQ